MAEPVYIRNNDLALSFMPMVILKFLRSLKSDSHLPKIIVLFASLKAL